MFKSEQESLYKTQVFEDKTVVLDTLFFELWYKNKMKLLEQDVLFMYFYIDQKLLEISEFLDGVVEGSSDLKWIVNGSRCFLLSFWDNVHVQLFLDEYIREVGKLLQKAMGRIQVLTIAMSPDCLIGEIIKDKWDNGFRVLELLAEGFYSLWDYPFP